MGKGPDTSYQLYWQKIMQDQALAAQKELSNQQIAAQQEIAQKQQDFNEQQLQAQKDLAAKQQADADAQAQRQTAYDTGRAKLLSEGTSQIDAAFNKFSPDYFQTYKDQYMKQVQDQLDYQKAQATKNMMFALAGQGLTRSQAAANQQGLITETEGRTLADQTQQAQNAAENLRSNVAATKQNLEGQVQSAESIGSSIAASDMGGVNAALQTQKNAISGVTTSAGDVTAQLGGVPTVSTLGNIFANVLGGAGSYLGGVGSNIAAQNYNRYFAGLPGPKAPNP